MAGGIDLIGEIRNLMNKSGAETFDPATDSLEAIADALTGGGTGSPGLCYLGIVTAVPGANQFTIPTLAGHGATAFVDWAAYVFWDTAGVDAPPQREQQNVATYDSATGTFSTAPFTAAVAAGDIILILHPRIASILTLIADMNRPGADALTNDLVRDVVGNKADTAQQTAVATASLMRYLKGLITALGNPTGDTLTSITAKLGDTASSFNTRFGRQLFTMDFWSATQALVSLTDTAAPGTDTALPDVVVAGLPAGATIVRATVFMKFRILENSNAAANKLQGAQNIQVQKGGAGGYSTGIALVDDLFGIAAGPLREAGDVLMGNTDLAAKITGNDTYNVQWTAALVDQANLNFYDVQTGIRIWYSV